MAYLMANMRLYRKKPTGKRVAVLELDRHLPTMKATAKYMQAIILPMHKEY